MLETRHLSPAGLPADAARALLEWLVAHGADEFTVEVMTVADEPASVADAFEDALAPLELPAARRPIWDASARVDVLLLVRRWALTADSVDALLGFLPADLFEAPVGPGGWLENLTVFRRGELVLGVLTHEREGVLRLTPDEHAEVRSLGVTSSAGRSREA